MSNYIYDNLLLKSERKYKNINLIIIKGDITKLKTDCIVNAANEDLIDGCGINGAIINGAGKNILIEMNKLNGCFTGQSKITKNYNLKCKCIIHTVGPNVLKYDNCSTERYRNKLSSCYYQSLSIANENKYKSISFPCLSTGIYSYPLDEATHIAINSVLDYIDDNNNTYIKDIVFCVFNDEQENIYQQYFNTILIDN